MLQVLNIYNTSILYIYKYYKLIHYINIYQILNI
jgi:hypothetical protein